jgi:hypothetical protein
MARRFIREIDYSITRLPDHPILEAADVWQPGRDGADGVESIQQHRGRVPLTGQESVAQGGRQRRREPERSAVTFPDATSAATTTSGVFSMSDCRRSTSFVVRREARHAEHRALP